jgi:hypothetical protein
MKKLISLGILFITFVLALSFTTALAGDAAVSRFFSHGMPIQARHSYNREDIPIIDLNKHDLTLKKGKSETLKVSVKPGGKSVSVMWQSSNPKIAKVNDSGKVTAVAPGIAVIWASTNAYMAYYDQTGYSNNCYVNVPGDAKDAKPLGASDRTFTYGKTKLVAPTGKYSEALASVKKSIGGHAYKEIDGTSTYNGLRYDSKERNKAHSDIYIYSYSGTDLGFGYDAREKSPIKTSRGIAIGAKKSAVQKLYGTPASASEYKEGGQTFEILGYDSKTAGKNQYTKMTFHVLKSKSTVVMMFFYFGG